MWELYKVMAHICNSNEPPNIIFMFPPKTRILFEILPDIACTSMNVLLSLPVFNPDPGLYYYVTAKTSKNEHAHY